MSRSCPALGARPIASILAATTLATSGISRTASKAWKTTRLNSRDTHAAYSMVASLLPTVASRCFPICASKIWLRKSQVFRSSFASSFRQRPGALPFGSLRTCQISVRFHWPRSFALKGCPLMAIKWPECLCLMSMFIVCFRFGSALQVAPTAGHPDPRRGTRCGMKGAIGRTGLVENARGKLADAQRRASSVARECRGELGASHREGFC